MSGALPMDEKFYLDMAVRIESTAHLLWWPAIGCGPNQPGLTKASFARDPERKKWVSHAGQAGEYEMSKKLYVGNLGYDVSDADLEQLFAEYGTVQSAQVIQDRMEGRSKGFGFVEMDQAGAGKAITALDGWELDGRNLKVNEAKEREERPRQDRW